jgi:hypothetical protein
MTTDHSPTAESAGYTSKVRAGHATLQEALSAAQGEMSAASKDRKNPHLNSKYATLASVIDALREPFANHGLSHWAVPSMDLEAGVVRVEVFIGHSSGGQVVAPLSAKWDVGKGLSSIQSAGVLITYMRRYGLMSLAGISSAEDDNDGNAPAAEREQPVKAPVVTAPVPAAREKEQELVALALSGLRSARSEDDLHKIRVILNSEESKRVLTAAASAALRDEFTAARLRLQPPDIIAAESVPKLGQ